MPTSQAVIDMEKQLGIKPGDKPGFVESRIEEGRFVTEAEEKEKEEIKKQFEAFTEKKISSLLNIFFKETKETEAKEKFIQLFEKIIVYREILFYLFKEKDRNEYYIDYISKNISETYKKYDEYLFKESSKESTLEERTKQYIETKLNVLLLTYNIGNCITKELCNPIIEFIKTDLFKFKPIDDFVDTISKLLQNNEIQKAIESLKDKGTNKEHNETNRINNLQIIILEMYKEIKNPSQTNSKKQEFYNELNNLLRDMFKIQNTKYNKKISNLSEEDKNLTTILNDENDIFFKLLLAFNKSSIYDLLKVIEYDDNLGTQGETAHKHTINHSNKYKPFVHIGDMFLNMFFKDYNLLKLLKTYFEKYNDNFKQDEKEFYPYLHHLFCLMSTNNTIDINFNKISESEPRPRPITIECNIDLKTIVKKTLQEPFNLFISDTTTEDYDCNKLHNDKPSSSKPKYYGFLTSVNSIYYDLFEKRRSRNPFLKFLLPLDKIKKTILLFDKDNLKEYVKGICENYTSNDSNLNKELMKEGISEDTNISFSVKILLNFKLENIINKLIKEGHNIKTKKGLLETFRSEFQKFKTRFNTNKNRNRLNTELLEKELDKIHKYFDENKDFFERILALKKDVKMYTELIESELKKEQLEIYIYLVEKLKTNIITYLSILNSLQKLVYDEIQITTNLEDFLNRLEIPESNPLRNKIKIFKTLIQSSEIIKKIEKSGEDLDNLEPDSELYKTYKDAIKTILPQIWIILQDPNITPTPFTGISSLKLIILKRVIKGRLLELSIFKGVFDFIFKIISAGGKTEIESETELIFLLFEVLNLIIKKNKTINEINQRIEQKYTSLNGFYSNYIKPIIENQTNIKLLLDEIKNFTKYKDAIINFLFKSDNIDWNTNTIKNILIIILNKIQDFLKSKLPQTQPVRGGRRKTIKKRKSKKKLVRNKKQSKRKKKTKRKNKTKNKLKYIRKTKGTLKRSRR